MGLKSGSRDAGLDDEEDGEQEPPEGEADPADEAVADSQPSETTASPGTATGPTDSDGTTEGGNSSDGRPRMSSIPYKLRRDTVNEGRSQVPYFLRDEIVEAEDDLRDELETILEENVYKSDYREAAMVVAQRNPDLVAEVLREWGYDLDM